MSRLHSSEIVAALILIVLGLLLLAGNLQLIAFNWGTLWALLLILFGAWLIWRALAAPERAAVHWSMGDYRPDLSGKEIRSAQFSHGFGDFDLDLAHAVIPEGESSVRASLGLGDLKVIVPRDLAVRVRASAGLGDVGVFGEKSEGIAPHLDFQSDDYAAAARKLDLEANVGLGEVKIVRGA